jgi:hypothetical protein
VRAALPLALAALLGLAAPAPAPAWGFDVHRLLTNRAIDRLPPSIRPFFERRRAFIVEHSIDPDLWRTAGWDEEPPRHFIDLDEYGQPPFRELPRDHDRAVERYGAEFVRRNGTLPWRVAEVFGELRRSFEQQRRGGAGYTLDDIAFRSAVLAHYVQDGFVPLHTVKNYNGQLTRQHGIHYRWETDLVIRYRTVLRLEPPPLRPVPDPRAFMFEVLEESFPHAAAILAADKAAAAGRDVYDDAYFERLFAESRPVLEDRMSNAIAAVASIITAAWEAGGKPELPAEQTRQPGRIRGRR